MESWLDNFVSRTFRIVIFGGNEHPVDVVEASELGDKESFRHRRAHNNDTCHTGLARSMDSVYKIFQRQVVGLRVGKVVTVCQHSIVIAFESIDNLLMLSQTQMIRCKTSVFNHKLFGKIDQGIYTQSASEERAKHIAKHTSRSSNNCNFFHSI